MNETTRILCDHIGIAGTTPCRIKKHDDGKYEARIGIALMGATNMDILGFEACDYNPFHPDYQDNYCHGVGDTEEEAVEAMKEDMKDMSRSLFA